MLQRSPDRDVDSSITGLENAVKNTRTCPKCQSRDIIVIPGNVGAHGSGNNVQIGWLRYAKVTRYLCGSCGFSEEWVEDPGARQKLKEKHRR